MLIAIHYGPYVMLAKDASQNAACIQVFVDPSSCKELNMEDEFNKQSAGRTYTDIWFCFFRNLNLVLEYKWIAHLSP